MKDLGLAYNGHRDDRRTQLFRLTEKWAMSSVKIYDLPVESALLNEHILHKDWQRLILQAPNKCKLALEPRIFPGRWWGRRFECKYSMWDQFSRNPVGQLRIDIVEQDLDRW